MSAQDLIDLMIECGTEVDPEALNMVYADEEDEDNGD